MLRLRVIQAEFGDCLILEFGTSVHPHYILIDGGPAGTFKAHLEIELKAISQRGKGLDLVVLSHVDNDHVTGLLELMAAQVQNRDAKIPDVIRIDSLWHNAFSETVGEGNNFAQRMDSFMAMNPQTFGSMAAANEVMFGITEGNQLLMAQQELGFPRNQGFAGGLITPDAAVQPIHFANLQLWVAAPTKQHLERLKKEWKAWLLKVEKVVPAGTSFETEKVDQSIPNLSSIMFLAVSGKRKILLTGDGLGTDLVDGLRQAGLLDPEGKLHVDVLKLPHHGSSRNVTHTFFDTITADTYVISANGKYNNPDLATLIWLVEAAKRQGRRINILATNETESTRQLVTEYPPAEYGYKLSTLGVGQHSMVV